MNVELEKIWKDAVLIEKLKLASREILEGSLLCSQKSAIVHIPEPDKSRPHSQILFILSQLHLQNGWLSYLSCHPKIEELGYLIQKVSDYWLDDRVRFPAEARDFPLASVSRSFLRSTQPPVQWVLVVLSAGVKRGSGVTLTTHPHLVRRLRVNRSCTSSPS
jgi:hypothetical protein